MMLRITGLSIGYDREFSNQAWSGKARVKQTDSEILDYNKAQLIIQFL